MRPESGLDAPIVTGKQEGCHRIGEAVRVFPEQQMTKAGKGDEPGIRDSPGEKPRVARVDHGVRVAVHDQRARLDARLPQLARVPRSRASLGRQEPGIRGPRAEGADQAVDEFWLAQHGTLGQRVLDMAAHGGFRRHPGGRGDEPHGRRGHRVGERPARRRADQDEAVDSLRVLDRELLGYHAAQARAQQVGTVHPGSVEHREDVTHHVGYRERARRAITAPESPVVDEHQPEAAV